MRSVRASAPPLLSALSILALIGCASPAATTPPACLRGPDAYLAALKGAPRPARLAGGVAISECLSANQEGGTLAGVGESMLSAANQLNAAARAKPSGEAGLQLGYLLGAAQRGAERTGGIHAELIRRLRAAARYSPGGDPLPAAFRHAYREGFAAGHAGG